MRLAFWRRRRPEIVCQQWVEIVTDYVEGALPAPDRARFDDHLRDCDGCLTYLEQMRTTIRLVGTLTEDGVDSLARDRLLHVFRDWNRREAANEQP